MKRTEIYWNAVDTNGLEHLVLIETQELIMADGLVLRNHNGQGLRLRYHLQCDSTWKPCRFEVHLFAENAPRLRLSADGSGSWFDDQGQPLERLHGCIDLDLMATPFTNTLAIRHLGLRSGESGEIEVVYVAVPALSVQRAAQRYTCLSQTDLEARYLYQSLESDFRAELLVDARQLVVSYQGVWQRSYISNIQNRGML